MAKTLYRVGEGANLEALPRGTRIGDTIHLTEAEALYERDMGRLIDVEAEKAGAAEIEALAAAEIAASELRTAEADGIVKTAVAGDTLDVTEGEADAPKIGRD